MGKKEGTLQVDQEKGKGRPADVSQRANGMQI
jgi:hypothetical protein